MYIDLSDMDTFNSLPIDDSVLCDRVVEYLQKYHLIKGDATNCSTLARFLFDGKFVECSSGNEYFSFEESFVFYSNQEINTGDTICFLFHRRIVNDHEDIITRLYLEMKDSLAKHLFCGGGSVLVSSSDIRTAFKNSQYDEFHLVVCLDGEKKMFIHQDGIDGTCSIFTLKDVSGFSKIPATILLRRKK